STRELQREQQHEDDIELGCFGIGGPSPGRPDEHAGKRAQARRLASELLGRDRRSQEEEDDKEEEKEKVRQEGQEKEGHEAQEAQDDEEEPLSRLRIAGASGPAGALLHLT